MNVRSNSATFIAWYFYTSQVIEVTHSHKLTALSIAEIEISCYNFSHFAAILKN